MRTGLMVAAAVLAVVAVCGAATLHLTGDISQTYMQAAEELRGLCMQKDWPRAREKAEERSQSWKKTTSWLQMLINHEDTDDVAMALAAISAGIEAEDLAGCLVGCGQLREAAEHISHRDAFTWGNIL